MRQAPFLSNASPETPQLIITDKEDLQLQVSNIKIFEIFVYAEVASRK
jgi:hypothetical protein